MEDELSKMKKDQYDLYREVKTFDKRVEAASKDYLDKSNSILGESAKYHKDFELRAKGLVDSYNANDERNQDKLKKLESKFMDQLEKLKHAFVLCDEKLDDLCKKITEEKHQEDVLDMKKKMAAMLAAMGG